MNMTDQNTFDVVVVGAGSAALNAALSASEKGAKVLVIEKAPEHLRGGNSYFTGGLFRFSYQGIDDITNLLPEMGEEEVNKIEGHSSATDRFSVKARLNLNDLLRRRSEEKQVDKKTNLIILSSVTGIAAEGVLILSL